MQGSFFLWIAAGACAGAILSFLWLRLQRRSSASSPAEPQVVHRARAVKGSVHVVHPDRRTAEGLEIQYGEPGLVRSVRVGAMNDEHKELLLTMDAVVWQTLPNAHKQEVLAAARSTWAAKMCAGVPDIAYVVLKTETGEIVGRADPHSVRIV